MFSTAADLARFGRTLLGDGALDGARILTPLTVARMTSPATPAGMRDVRGLGWDIDSSYSANRGALFPVGSFGHTGFTGTSIWVDPSSRTFVVFLSNRVHPDGGGRVVALRGRVATLAAAAGSVARLGLVAVVGLYGGRIPFGFGAVPHEARFMTSVWGSRAQLDELLGLAGREPSVLNPVETLPLEDAQTAHDRLRAGQVESRIVLAVS